MMRVVYGGGVRCVVCGVWWRVLVGPRCRYSPALLYMLCMYSIDSIEQSSLHVLWPVQPPHHQHHRHQPNSRNIPQISLVYFQTTAQINPTQFCEV